MRHAVLLSVDAILVYILAESGVRGQLNSGRIERDPLGKVDVFDSRGDRVEYLSGGRIRSWCVMGPRGKALEGWREILPEDLPKFAE